jgi:hypothetical protein
VDYALCSIQWAKGLPRAPPHLNDDLGIGVAIRDVVSQVDGEARLADTSPTIDHGARRLGLQQLRHAPRLIVAPHETLNAGRKLVAERPSPAHAAWDLNLIPDRGGFSLPCHLDQIAQAALPRGAADKLRGQSFACLVLQPIVLQPHAGAQLDQLVVIERAHQRFA